MIFVINYVDRRVSRELYGIMLFKKLGALQAGHFFTIMFGALRHFFL